MLDFSRWKIRAICGGLLILMLFAVPSFVPEQMRAKWPSWVPRPAINLGLDLAGGSYLLLEAETKDVATAKLEQMRETVRTEVRKAPKVEIGDISVKDGTLRFMVVDPTKVDLVRERLNPYTTGAAMTGQRDWNINVVNSQEFVLTPTEAGLNVAIERAMGDATENVRRRIDALGTREPTIIRQGSDRIVVQVPGLKDPTALKELIGKTGKLEFRLVDMQADPTQVAQGVAPDGDILLPDAETGGKIAVSDVAMITGDQLINANQQFSPQDGRPEGDDPARRRREQALRQGDHRECRQAVRDHRRQCRHLGTAHQRADPRRPGEHHRRVHRRQRQPARDSRCDRASCRCRSR